jgi:hypothetical protein
MRSFIYNFLINYLLYIKEVKKDNQGIKVNQEEIF